MYFSHILTGNTSMNSLNITGIICMFFLFACQEPAKKNPLGKPTQVEASGISKADRTVFLMPQFKFYFGSRGR